ncbi:hypothetical protein Moror_11772 [Moniliophthora roreri MCA 2997]|uniref:Uncharacterized protein n=2 Tax=Moniliophthora roreri TaxID=221103 RepID=V2WN39_MONRO|nr:hypothetical protein Moror_11772 [Moniliophthora roreri MCA 2997]
MVGFALLNFGTYIFWWNKPLRVRYPVQVTWRQQELLTAGSSQSEESGVKTVKQRLKEALACLQKGIIEILNYLTPEGVPLAIQLIFLPLWMMWTIIRTCLNFFTDDQVFTDEFNTRLEEDPLQLYITVYSIAAAFGAIHCIPWAFQFPTETEQLLWQICAIAVAAAPIAMGSQHWYSKGLYHSTPRWLDKLMDITATFLGIVYIISRLTLISLALMALRDLSQSAYQTVQWTTFVPHIG